MAIKVLLADDSMTAQNMGKKILAEAGFEVIAVSNGAQALKKTAEQKPDLIILDVYMPGYTGLEVCEKLRAAHDTARVPILLTVGKMEPYRPEDGARVKADGIIIKPFEATDLIAVVKKLAEKNAPAAKPDFDRTVVLKRSPIKSAQDFQADDTYAAWAASAPADPNDTAEMLPMPQGTARSETLQGVGDTTVVMQAVKETVPAAVEAFAAAASAQPAWTENTLQPVTTEAPHASTASAAFDPFAETEASPAFAAPATSASPIAATFDPFASHTASGAESPYDDLLGEPAATADASTPIDAGPAPTPALEAVSIGEAAPNAQTFDPVATPSAADDAPSLETFAPGADNDVRVGSVPELETFEPSVGDVAHATLDVADPLDPALGVLYASQQSEASASTFDAATQLLEQEPEFVAELHGPEVIGEFDASAAGPELELDSYSTANFEAVTSEAPIAESTATIESIGEPQVEDAGTTSYGTMSAEAAASSSDSLLEIEDEPTAAIRRHIETAVETVPESVGDITAEITSIEEVAATPAQDDELLKKQLQEAFADLPTEGIAGDPEPPQTETVETFSSPAIAASTASGAATAAAMAPEPVSDIERELAAAVVQHVPGNVDIDTVSAVVTRVLGKMLPDVLSQVIVELQTERNRKR